MPQCSYQITIICSLIPTFTCKIQTLLWKLILFNPKLLSLTWKTLCAFKSKTWNFSSYLKVSKVKSRKQAKFNWQDHSFNLYILSTIELIRSRSERAFHEQILTLPPIDAINNIQLYCAVTFPLMPFISVYVPKVICRLLL